jgi:hypothetical protein
MHVCLLSLVLSASPVIPQLGQEEPGDCEKAHSSLLAFSFLFFAFVLMALGFELRALKLLDRYSTT